MPKDAIGGRGCRRPAEEVQTRLMNQYSRRASVPEGPRGTGHAVRLAVVLGSHAVGAAGPESDIDLVVVSPAFDGEYSRELVSRLSRTAARTDSRIEPIPCGERQWREDGASPILEIARRQGIPVTSEET